MRLFKKTTIAIFSILFIFGMMFAFNFVQTNIHEQESVYADTNLIEIGETSYSSLEEAIDASPYNVQTEIKLSGNFSIASKITIAGDKNLGYKKLIFNVVGDTTIIRANSNAFNMFEINEFSEVEFKTSNNAKLILDGNRGNIEKSEEAIIFKVTTSKFSLNGENGEIVIQNNSTDVGAGINVSASSNVTVKKVEFKNNIAHGWAAAIYNAGVLNIDNCSFTNNFGGCSGGVIYSQGTTTISNSVFDGNGLKGYQNYGTRLGSSNGSINGGVLAVQSGTTTVVNCIFKNSNSQSTKDVLVRSYGGVMDIMGGTLNIVSATLSNNTADYGGAIFVYGGTLNITDISMTGNNALYDAGGIYAYRGTVKINGGTIGGNIAPTGKPQDVIFASNSTSSVFSANITSQNTYAIYSSVDFYVGKNFAMGQNSHLLIEKGKKIYVKEQLLTENPILVDVNGVTDDQEILGQDNAFIYFENQQAVKEGIFVLSKPEYSFALPGNYQELTTPFLYVSIEYLVEFYQYYDVVSESYVNKIGTTQKIPYGGSALEPSASEIGTREGFIFGGWSEEFTNVTGNLKIYGIWGQEITITFKIFDEAKNSWENFDTDKIVSGTKLSNLPTIPSKTGYQANEPYWAYDTNGSTQYNNENLSEATTLYAIYVPDILKVTFIRANGSSEEIEVDYNSAFTKDIPAIEEKTGYNQTAPYWAYDELGENVFDASRIIKSNFNLYEIYKINHYSVEFYVNYYHNLSAEGGKELLECKKVGSSVVAYNEIISQFPILPLNLAFTQNNVVWDYNNEQITNDITIYGDIDINVYLVKFEIDGEIVNSYNVEHGKTLLEVPEIPSKTGFDQNAPVWHLQGVELTDAITSNRTFVAKYIQNIYTVTFILPDGNRVERSVKHGESVNADNIITKGFGELIRFDRSLDNITEDCEIHVSKINLFMWIMIAFGALLLIILIIVIAKIIKKKKMQSIARKKNKHRRNHVGPFVTGDDE